LGTRTGFQTRPMRARDLKTNPNRRFPYDFVNTLCTFCDQGSRSDASANWHPQSRGPRTQIAAAVSSLFSCPLRFLVTISIGFAEKRIFRRRHFGQSVRSDLLRSFVSRPIAERGGGGVNRRNYTRGWRSARSNPTVMAVGCSRCRAREDRF